MSVAQNTEQVSNHNSEPNSVIPHTPLKGGQSLLNHYLQQAAQNNPELKAMYRQYLAALEEVPQVSTLPDPKLSFGYFISPIETRLGPQQARFGITQMFPWFGTLNARAEIAAQMAKAKFEAFREARNKLFYEVHKTWYNLYKMERAIGIMQENIAILETYESLVTSRYETAQAGQADILRVQIEKEDLVTKLEGLKDDLQVKEQVFRELINQSYTDTNAVKDRLDRRSLALSIAGIEQAVLQQNPRLTMLDFKATSARHSVEVAQKEGMPRFGIGVDYIVTGRRDMALPGNGRDAILARGGIQIPLYRKKYRAKEKQAQLKLRAVRDRQTAARNRLQTQLDEALRDYHDARRRLSLYQDIQIQRTHQTIDILTEEYANGTTDFEELLRMQRKLLDYQLKQKEALKDVNTSVAYIEYLYGKYNVNLDQIELNGRD